MESAKEKQVTLRINVNPVTWARLEVLADTLMIKPKHVVEKAIEEYMASINLGKIASQ